MAYDELQRVVVVRDVRGTVARRGSRGTVVAVYAGGAAYEVEFTNEQGQTVAVETVESQDLCTPAEWEA